MPQPFADSAAILPAPAAARGSRTEISPAVPTILVVDDEREVVTALESALRVQGYRVATACNGSDAIDKAIKLRPEIVVTDLLMPVVDGIALAKALRLNPVTAAIRIVLSSGVAEGSVRAMFNGYDAFLQKPYEMEDLQQTVAGLLAPAQ